MKEASEIQKKSSTYFVSKVVGQLIGFISVIVVTRLLGATVYGEYVYVSSMLSFIYLIPLLGMNNGIVSFLSRSTISIVEKRSILTYSVVVSSILSVIVIFMGLFFRETVHNTIFISGSTIDLFSLILPSTLLICIKMLYSSALRALKDIKSIALLDNILAPIIRVAVVMILSLLLNIKSYHSLLIALYIELIISIVLYVVKLKKLNYIGPITKGISNIAIIKFSTPLLMLGVINTLNHNIDKFMIGYFLESDQVAIYKVALQFGTISGIVMVSVNTIFAPIISNLYYDNKLTEIKKLYQKSTRWILISNLFIFGIYLALSSNVMKVAGDEFTQGSFTLIIITFGQLIYASVGSVGNINIMTGHPKYNLIAGTISVLINIFLNMTLIPQFGIDGAALSTAISLAITNLINLFLMYRNIRMHPFQWMTVRAIVVMICSSASIFLIVRMLQGNHFLELIIGSIIYTMIFGLMSYKYVIHKEEKRVIIMQLRAMWAKVSKKV